MKQYRYNQLIKAGILLTVIFTIISCKKDETVYPIHESPFVWIGGEHTLLKSANTGETWENIFNTPNFRVVYFDQAYYNIGFANTIFGCVAGNFSGNMTTRNGEYFDGNYGGYADDDLLGYNDLSMLDSNTYYICGDISRIFFYKNKISTYIKPPLYATGLNTPTLNFYGIEFFNMKSGWVVGNFNGAYYTTNAGNSWEFQPTGTNNFNKDIKLIPGTNSNELLIAGSNGAIYKTKDKGKTWKLINSNTTNILTCIYVGNENDVFICGHNGTILKSTDNGESFQKMNSGISDNLNSISFKNAEVGFAVGDNGTVLKTSDGGVSWQIVSMGFTNNLYSVCCVKRFLKK